MYIIRLQLLLLKPFNSKKIKSAFASIHCNRMPILEQYVQVFASYFRILYYIIFPSLYSIQFYNCSWHAIQRNNLNISATANTNTTNGPGIQNANASDLDHGSKANEVIFLCKNMLLNCVLVNLMSCTIYLDFIVFIIKLTL